MCNRSRLFSNALTALPDVSALTELELARFSDNRLVAVHPSLFGLPRLSWLALGGNEPLALDAHLPPVAVPEVALEGVSLGRVLGYAVCGLKAGCYDSHDGAAILRISPLTAQSERALQVSCTTPPSVTAVLL